MREFELPLVGGRKVRIRPCVPGPSPQVQVAIISTRGNIIEAFNLETTEALGFCRGLGKVARESIERSADAVRKERTDNDRRHIEALARNPWLREMRGDRERRGLR